MTHEQLRRLWDFFTAVLFPKGEPRELPLPTPQSRTADDERREDVRAA